jgi:hypothetical protein
VDILMRLLIIHDVPLLCITNTILPHGLQNIDIFCIVRRFLL